MKKLVLIMSAFTILSGLTFCKASAEKDADTSMSKTKNATQTQPQERPANFTELLAFELKAPCKRFYSWEIGDNTEITEPDRFDFSKRAQVEQALEEDVICSPVSLNAYEPDLTPGSFSGITTKVGCPGEFKVTCKDGYPVKFVLDEKALQRDLDNGNIFLDAYEIGLKGYELEYGANGLPKKLTGKGLGGFFWDGDYVETYSNYKYDKHGNWVSRDVFVHSANDYKVTEYREYEY